MKEHVLEDYGVQITRTPRGVKYTLPWRRHMDLKCQPWTALFVAFLPCVAAGGVPVGIWYLTRTTSPLFWAWAVCWWCLMVFFVVLFGAMTYSEFTRWGRAWIWISPSRLVAARLCPGAECGVAYVELQRVKGFSTLPDGDDPANPATPARLLVDLPNDVKRLALGYPIELVNALRDDLTERVKELRH